MKAIVLFSGGLDSTTCLGLAVKQYGKDEVLALSIYYGQKHKKELLASKKICEFYQVKHQIIDLQKIFEKSKCSLLKQSNQDIPLSSYQSQQNQNYILSTYVPYRNGLFISVAASIAISYDADVIYYGIHKDELINASYPDSSIEFNNAIKKAIYIGSGKLVKVYAPFVNKTKGQIVKQGLRLNVPYKLTWSCYLGHNKACGKCGTCIDRQKAFYENNLTDPIKYEYRIPKDEL